VGTTVRRSPDSGTVGQCVASPIRGRQRKIGQMIHTRTPHTNTRQKCLVCEGIGQPITSRMDFKERIHTFAAKTPAKAPDAFIAPGAVLVGDVQVGQQASIWFQATVRADLNAIRIGARSNIQDGAVIHVADAHGTVIGEDVTVGHCAILHACTVGDAVLIGMNAVVLDGAVIGSRSIVGANALVTAGTQVPEGSLFLGSPGKVVRTLTAQEQADIASWAERYVLLSGAYRSGVACVEIPNPAPPPSA
jgi:carbonic anhydrase/acetyltransferase-like protein (isoleucine patch superfamily)